MTAPALTDRILRQGKALVRAIEALGTIEPSGPIERAAARVTEETLSTDERVGDRRAVIDSPRTDHAPSTMVDASRQDSWLQV